MTKAGFTPLLARTPPRYDDIAHSYAQYADITHHPAWKDYQYRLTQLRDGTVQSLLNGTLDNFGNTHDNELRRVLYALNTLLGYVPTLNREFERATADKEKVERRAALAAGAPIHGQDSRFAF